MKSKFTLVLLSLAATVILSVGSAQADADRWGAPSVIPDAAPNLQQRCFPSGSVVARQVVTKMASGQPIECEGLEVNGDLDLREIPIVTASFRCRACTFEGSILATDVDFRQIVQLDGSQIDGWLDFRGSTFEKVLSFESEADRIARVAGKADFSKAVFEDAVEMRGAFFRGVTSFQGVRFQSNLSMDQAGFLDFADFSSASFEGDVALSGTGQGSGQLSGNHCEPGGDPTGISCGETNFERAHFFKSVDFSQRRFQGEVNFEGSTFDRDSNFTGVRFSAPVTFEAADLQGGATFRSAAFSEDASFRWTSMGGRVDFAGGRFAKDVDFFGANSSGAINLQGVIFSGDQVVLTQVRADDFRLDPELVASSQGTNIRAKFIGLAGALKLVAETSRARGDLELANEALYQLHILQSEDLRRLDKLGDLIYRWVGGYLVRPVVPLRNIGLLLLGATLIRLVYRKWPSVKGGPRHPGESKKTIVRKMAAASPHYLARTTTDVLGALEDTVRVLLSGKPNAWLDGKSGGQGHGEATGAADDGNTLKSDVMIAVRFVEWTVFKVLIVAFLLGLGNSNPTARQIIQGVLKGGNP